MPNFKTQFAFTAFLPFVCGLMLFGCQSTVLINSATPSPTATPLATPAAPGSPGPTPSPSALPSVSPTPSPSASMAAPSVPEEPFINFGAIQGYTAKLEFKQDLVGSSKDEAIDKAPVYCSQEAFDADFSSGSGSDSVNFEQSCVLVIAKTTFANRYTGAVKSIHLLKDQLSVEFAYDVFYDANPMYNDYGRTEFFFTRFDKVKYDKLSLIVTGKSNRSTSSPPPPPAVSQSTGSNAASTLAQ